MNNIFINTSKQYKFLYLSNYNLNYHSHSHFVITSLIINYAVSSVNLLLLQSLFAEKQTMQSRQPVKQIFVNCLLNLSL